MHMYKSRWCRLSSYQRVGIEAILGGRRMNSFVVGVMLVLTVLLFLCFLFLLQNVACRLKQVSFFLSVFCRQRILAFTVLLVVYTCISFGGGSLPVAYTLRTAAIFPAFHLQGLWLYIVATICVWGRENEREVAALEFISFKEALLNKLLSLHSKTAWHKNFPCFWCRLMYSLEPLNVIGIL